MHGPGVSLNVRSIGKEGEVWGQPGAVDMRCTGRREDSGVGGLSPEQRVL